MNSYFLFCCFFHRSVIFIMRVPCSAQIHHGNERLMDNRKVIKNATAVLSYESPRCAKTFSRVVLRVLSSSEEEEFPLSKIGDARVCKRKVDQDDVSVTITQRCPPATITLTGSPGSNKVVELAKAIGKLCVEKQIPKDMFHLISTHNGRKDFVKSIPVSLVVTEKKDYPPANYSKQLRHVALIDLRIRYFDRRLLKLTHLTTLTVTGNRLQEVPEICFLPFIQVVDLSYNEIKVWEPTTLVGPGQRTLRVINLNNNLLEYGPGNLYWLKKLERIDMSCNKLLFLPHNLPENKFLRHLNFKKNNMIAFPVFHRQRGIQFENMDLSDCSLRLYPLPPPSYGFSTEKNCRICKNIDSGLHESDRLRHTHVPTLQAMAGSAVIQKGDFNFDLEAVPKDIVRYLSRFYYCFCGQWKCGTYAKYHGWLKLPAGNNFSEAFSTSTLHMDGLPDGFARFVTFACSHTCAVFCKKYLPDFRVPITSPKISDCRLVRFL